MKFSDGIWKTGWEVRYDRWGREGNLILYTVNNLEPETRYSFRVIAENKAGASLASDSTVALKTGRGYIEYCWKLIGSMQLVFL